MSIVSRYLLGAWLGQIVNRITAIQERTIRFARERSACLPGASATTAGDELDCLGGSITTMMDAIERSEQILKASEAKYRQLHESMRDAFVSVDMEGRIVDFNRSYQEILGYTPEELKQLSYVDLTPQKWHAIEARIVRDEILPFGHSEVYEKEYIRKDGTVFSVELRTALLKDETGVNTGMWAIVRDITERKRTADALRNAEARYRQLFERSPNGIVLIDFETGKALEANAVAARQLGYTQEEFAGLTISDYEVIEKPEETALRLEKIKREGGDDFDTLHRTKSGEIRNVHVSVKTLMLGGRTVAYTIFQDITDRMQAEQRYQHILKTAIDGFWLTDARGLLLDVNDAYCRMSGYSREEMLRMHISDIEVGEKPEETRAHIEKVISQGYDRFTTTHRRKDGTLMDMEVSAQYLKEQGGMFIAFLQDVTERKRAADAISASLLEKETLLREIHHRVKNNLQIISSLLYFQAKKVADPAGLAALREGQDRLKSMILVHEKLYRSSDLARVDFGDYVCALTDQMLRSYGAVRGRISVSIEAGDIHLPIEIALPCGMIINELLTNVFKYAFPGERSGTALVRVLSEDHRILLTIRDSGVGLPPAVDADNPATFGLQLVRNLANQLRGEVSFERSGGTAVTISIPLDKAANRSGP